MSGEYPISVICQVFEVSRSSLYYKPVAPLAETETKSEIAKLAGEYPTYGYRRITAMLHRRGYLVNNKRVRRLMGEMGLVGKSPKKRCRTTNSQHEFPRYPNRVAGLVVERPDQLWVGDITYIKLGREFVYLAVKHGCFYPLYSRVAIGKKYGSRNNASGTQKSFSPWKSSDPSQ